MKPIKLLLLSITMFINTTLAQQNSETKSTISANNTSLVLPQIQIVPIQDSKTERSYELYIKLPKGYLENDDTKYPVLYFTDALWQIEILSGATQYMMKDIILVGISWQKDLKGELGKLGDHASRFRDYSIQPSSNPEAQAKYKLGQAHNHLDFIRDDVIKYIENNYRTDVDNRSYFGYSAGGKFGAYILLTKPSTFKNYILGSPSLSRGGKDVPVLSKLNANNVLNVKGLKTNVFISYGDLERDTSPYTDEIIAMLRNKNYESLLLSHQVIEGNHETAFPMTAVRSIRWLSDLIRE